MADQPDLRFDIDALFAHLRHLGDETECVKQWEFNFRSNDLARLERVAERAPDGFEAHLQEVTPTIEEDGSETMGPPLLVLGTLDMLEPAEVRAIAEHMAGLAREAGVEYEGVQCSEPFDEEAMFGWLDLESAIWRLRHFTDTGLGEGESIPFVFALAAGDRAVLESAAAALEAGAPADHGYEFEFGEDEEGGPILLVHCPGKNDGELLEARYREVERAAQSAGAEMLGAQFDPVRDSKDGEEDGAD